MRVLRLRMRSAGLLRRRAPPWRSKQVAVPLAFEGRMTPVDESQRRAASTAAQEENQGSRKKKKKDKEKLKLKKSSMKGSASDEGAPTLSWLPSARMPGLQSVLKTAMTAAICDEFGGDLPEAIVTTARAGANKDGTGADFQCNSAFQIASSIGADPGEVAHRLAERVVSLKEQGRADAVHSAEVSGRAFVNIRVCDRWLVQRAARAAAASEDDGRGQVEKSVGEQERQPRVLVDFCSPNMGKELHLGHIRGAVVGDTLSNLLEYRGCDVQRVSHVGDWGVPVALVVAMLTREPEVEGEAGRWVRSVWCLSFRFSCLASRISHHFVYSAKQTNQPR